MKTKLLLALAAGLMMSTAASAQTLRIGLNEDPDVLEYCGTAVHLALVPAAADVEVPGKVLELEPDDLPAVDQYEGEKYRRVEVPLASGVTAWVYVKA